MEADAPAPGMPSVSISSVWRVIRNYIFWSYERGSIHYDILVTLILLFIFITPLFVNFHDKPAERSPHPTVIVISDGQNGFLYQVPTTAISAASDSGVREQLLRIIAPISGAASISKYEKTRDAAGEPVYQVWVKK